MRSHIIDKRISNTRNSAASSATTTSDTGSLENLDIKLKLKGPQTNTQVKYKLFKQTFQSIYASYYYKIPTYIIYIILISVADIFMIFGDKSHDLILIITLSILDVIFIAEIILCFIVFSNYRCSLTFVMDSINSITLLLDIYFFLYITNNSNIVLIVISSIRVLRLERLLRLSQSFIYEFSLLKTNNSLSFATPIYTLMNYYIMILVIVLIPFSALVNNQLPSQLLSIPFSILRSPDFHIFYSDLIEHSELPILLFHVGNDIIYEDHVTLGQLRGIEVLELSKSDVVIICSLSEYVRTMCIFHLILLFVSSIISLLSIFLLYKYTTKEIIQPFQRIISLITQLGASLSLVDDPQKDTKSLDETKIVENVIRRIVDIFNVQYGTGSSNNKALRMLTGSKTTEIKTKAVTYKINVVETANIPAPIIRQDLGTCYEQPDHLNLKILREASIPPDNFPELGNILYILQHPLATKYFKIYLARNLTLESYSLWCEIERFKMSTLLAALKIVDNFIVSSNLSLNHGYNEDRIKLKESIETRCFSINIFDSIQKKTMIYLDIENYKGFICSMECQQYVQKKLHDISPMLNSKIKVANISLHNN